MSFVNFNPHDIAALERLAKPLEPPQRIYHWRNSTLSIARFYGGLTYQGREYVIAENEEGQPLVRVDVLASEAKAKKAAEKTKRDAAKAAQKGLP